jgi:hypothetical protein
MPRGMSSTDIVATVNVLRLVFSLVFLNEIHAKISEFWDSVMLVVFEITPIIRFFDVSGTLGVAFQKKLLRKIMKKRRMKQLHYMCTSDSVSALLENLHVPMSCVIKNFLIATDPRAGRTLPPKIMMFFTKHLVTLPQRLRSIQFGILICAYWRMTNPGNTLDFDSDDSDDMQTDSVDTSELQMIT